MATDLVLSSKIHPPAPRPQTIDRARITRELVGQAAGLTLLVAPPGFGKSTVLSQWIEEDERPFAFVALEATENDPVALWTCIVLAIQRVEPSFGKSVEQQLRSLGGLAIDRVVIRILAEMEQLGRPLVLVLDDLHTVKNEVCHTSLTSLITNVPDVSVAISSRTDPPLPIGRMRASGDLCEVRGADLAFTREEAATFLNDVIGLDLADREIDDLVYRTEGWPAGLHLASLGLRATRDRDAFLASFDGSNRQIVDYLTEVVLDAVDDDTRSFLLETSVLSRMTAPLCDSVMGREGSAQMLDRLERANMFVIPLDDHRQWYRYHHLFADLLADELQRRRPGRSTGLHRAAFEWFLAAGDVDQAFVHALAAGAPDKAVELVAANYPLMIVTGRVATLMTWLDAFPQGYEAAQPQLSIVRAWVAGILGDEAGAKRALGAALEADTGAVIMDGSGSVPNIVALLRTRLPWGDVGEMFAAGKTLRGIEHTFPPIMRTAAAAGIGSAALLAGEIDEARQELDRAIELATAFDIPFILVNALGTRIQVAMQDGDVAAATAFGAQMMAVGTPGGLSDLPHFGYHLASYGAAIARGGQLEEGDDLLAQGIEQLGTFDAIFCAHARLMRAPVQRQLGDTEGARRSLTEARAFLERCTDSGIVGKLAVQVGRALSSSHRRGEERTDLTDRELDVLRLLDKGLSKRDVASELFLSFNTIHSHTKSIYTKLGVSTRDEALERAREDGFI